jgi:hypothetical protein
MLDKVILTSSYELGAHYAGQKKALVANSNSLLGQLVNLSSCNVESALVSPETLMTAEYINKTTDDLTAASTGTLENPSLHDNAIGQVIDTLSGVVASHIAIARNVVKPHVLEFMTEYAEYCQRNKVVDPASSFNIVQKELPALFEDQSFIEQFKYYEGKASIIPKGYVSFGDVVVDHNSLLSLGSARIDKLLAEAVIEMGDDFAKRVFEAFFRQNPDSGLDVSYSTLGQQNLYDALYMCLVLYTMAQKLHSNVPEGLNVSLSEYQSYMLEVRDFAGSMLNSLIKRAYFMIKNNTLILKSDSKTKSIYVQGSVYRAYLEQGGTVEMVLGVCATNSGATSLSTVLDSRDALTRGWNSYCSFASVSAENARLDNTKMFLLTVMNTHMCNLSDVEKEYVSKDPQYANTVMKVASEYIGCLKLHDLDLVAELALNLMARARFYFTAGYQILSGIEQATKLNPNLDPREAALVSAVNYVTDYLADQIAPVQS